MKTICSRYGLSLACFVILGLGVFALSDKVQAETGSVEEPTYLVLQLMGMTDNAAVSTRLPSILEELKETFGANPADSKRHLGFAPGLMPSLNWPAEVLKSRIVQGLELADQTGIAIFFHLDDHHFWDKRTDLHKDPDNVEWSAFPKAGESHGPIIPRYWLNWGTWNVFSAPPPCLESPKFRADSEYRLRTCVAEPILEWVETWKKEGREYLFAGVAVGNEQEVDPFDMRGLRNLPEGREPVATDRSKNPPVQVRMSRDEMVRAGYSALHKRGHNDASISRLAKEQGKSIDEVTSDLLHEIAHDYAEFRSKVLYDAGIPRERIYTHFTSLQGDGAKARIAAGATEGLRHAGLERYPSVKDSVNPYSRPGFTVQRDMVDLASILPQIEDARGDSVKDLAWGVIETYSTTGQPGRPQTLEEYEPYLGGLFAKGARVVNLYGWNIPNEGHSAPYSVKNAPGVIKTVQDWLNGKQLPTNWVNSWSDSASSQSDPPLDLQGKMTKLQDGVRQLQQQGKDLSPIREIMGEFQSLTQSGEQEKAAAVLDRAIQKLEEMEDK